MFIPRSTPAPKPASFPPASRGQGAIEYLLLLAAVLIIALIAVTLLTAFPNSSYDLRSSTSNTYWSSQASPFLITGQNLSADGVLTLALMNAGPATLKLTRMNVSGTGMNTSSSTVPLSVAAGKRARMTVFLNGSCAPGQVYEMMVNMTLINADSELPARGQYGAEPLVGRCNVESVFPAPPPPPPPPGGLPNGAFCSNPNECLSGHCHKTEVGKICVECIGDGHCSPPKVRCFNYVCHEDDDDD